jgi:hypothetical protein
VLARFCRLNDRNTLNTHVTHFQTTEAALKVLRCERLAGPVLPLPTAIIARSPTSTSTSRTKMDNTYPTYYPSLMATGAHLESQNEDDQYSPTCVLTFCTCACLLTRYFSSIPRHDHLQNVGGHPSGVPYSYESTSTGQVHMPGEVNEQAPFPE